MQPFKFYSSFFKYETSVCFIKGGRKAVKSPHTLKIFDARFAYLSGITLQYSINFDPPDKSFYMDS